MSSFGNAHILVARKANIMPLINGGKLIAPAIALMVSFAILTFTGCLGGGGGGGGTGGTSISISGFAYVPANITVSVGTT